MSQFRALLHLLRLMANWRTATKLALLVSLVPATVFGQWNPDNPIEDAPAKDKIPAYVRHGTYMASKAPLPGPIMVGYNYHLPPGYDTSDARYPVIYQLGGHTDNESIGLVDRGLPNRYQEKMEDGSIRPVISVYANGPGTLESYSQLESTLIEELIPHIDGKLRTLTSSACRHIEGYSRGGSGAPLFAFRHPDLFSAAVSNAGSGTEGITEALPGLKAAALQSGLRLLVTILEGDRLYPENQAFCEFLEQQQIPYDYVAAPGGSHDTNKYFNDPQNYAAIGYGNILWHERAFQQQGCGQEPNGMGGSLSGGASAGGQAGSNAGMLGGSGGQAGAPAAGGSGGQAGETVGGASSGTPALGSGGSAAPAAGSRASNDSSCNIVRRPTQGLTHFGWLAAVLLAAGARRRPRLIRACSG